MAEFAMHIFENNGRNLLVFLGAAAICLFACMSVHGQQAEDPAHIDIYVTPWYNSAGPTIDIGPFSKGLTSTNDATFVATIREMKRDWSKLSFIEMYVAAIRLYDQGYRKESIYWFYSAQYRGRLFGLILDEKKAGGIGDPGFELLHASDAFQTLAGPYLNGYAFGNTDTLSEVIQRVQKENENLPDIKAAFPHVIFKKESEWPQQNREIGRGLGELLSMIKEQKNELKQQRIKTGAEAKFGKLTNREFPADSEKLK